MRIAMIALALVTAPVLAQPATPTSQPRSSYWFLSPEGQSLMAAFQRETREAMRERMKTQREASERARAAVADALAADPFDAVRLHRALHEQQSIWTEFQRQGLVRQLDVYRQLSPADRRALADRMRDPARLGGRAFAGAVSPH